MAGRPHRTEGPVEGAVEHPVDGIDHGPGSQERRLVGLRPRLRVGVETVDPSLRGGDVGQVTRSVDAQQLRGGRGTRGQDPELRLEARLPDPPADRLETVGPLGMAGSGVVLAEERVVVEADAEGFRAHRSS